MGGIGEMAALCSELLPLDVPEELNQRYESVTQGY